MSRYGPTVVWTIVAVGAWVIAFVDFLESIADGGDPTFGTAVWFAIALATSLVAAGRLEAALDEEENEQKTMDERLAVYGHSGRDITEATVKVVREETNE